MAMRLDAYKAVKEKKVTLRIKPVDSYRRTQVDIQSNTKEDVDLDFSGTAFIPTGNSDAQRLGLTYMTGHEPGTYVVNIPSGARGSVQFEARCLDYHRPAPPNGLQYLPLRVPLPPLISEMMRRGVSQQDVWFDIENTPSLKAEWQAIDPRGRELKKGSIPISAMTRFSGEWYSPQYNYAFDLVGNRGLLTVLNSPETQKIGDECFRITWIEGTKFKGEHGFVDLTWHPVEGEFISDQEMRLRGRGLEWIMVRRG